MFRTVAGITHHTASGHWKCSTWRSHCEPESIPFTIKTDATVRVEVTNMRDESAAASDIAIPKTGEPFPYGSHALSTLFMAVALLCGVLLYRKRRRKHRTA